MVYEGARGSFWDCTCNKSRVQHSTDKPVCTIVCLTSTSSIVKFYQLTVLLDRTPFP